MLTRGKPMDHDVDHDQVDHRFTGGWKRFVVLAHSTIPADPPKGALYDPALRQHGEADERVGTFHDFQYPTAEQLRPSDQFARVAAVGPDFLQSRVHAAKLLEHQLGAVAVLDVRGMYHDGQNQPQRVDDDVPLATIDLLARVVTPRPPFSVVLTLWLSTIAAEGVGLRPALTRTFSRRSS